MRAVSSAISCGVRQHTSAFAHAKRQNHLNILLWHSSCRFSTNFAPTDPARGGYTAYGYGETWLDTLGFDSDSPIKTPSKIPLLGDTPVSDIACGWGHSAFVLNNGASVMVLGRPHDFRNTLKHINTRGGFAAIQRFMRKASKALFKSESNYIYHFDFAHDPVSFVRCSMGSLTAFGTASGKLYCMGQNFFGQCGVGTSAVEVAYEPMLVQGFEEGEKVVDVALGIEHAVAVTDSGAVYTWGRGDRGQLGHGDKDSFMKAARVVGPSNSLLGEHVIKVAANASSSACVTSAGKLAVWGKMQSQKVKEVKSGGNIMDDQLYPRQVDLPALDSSTISNHEVCDVTMGQAHCSFITKTGDVWMTGLRGRGVAFDDTAHYIDNVLRPAAVAKTEAFGIPAATFREWLETKSLALAESIPVPEVLNQVDPVQITSDFPAPGKIVKLRSGLHHSYGITDAGQVLRWGWKGIAVPCAELSEYTVREFGVGYHHSLLLA